VMQNTMANADPSQAWDIRVVSKWLPSVN